MANSLPSLTLRTKKSSAILLLLICSVFVAAGVWIGQSKDWKGYLAAAFFGLGMPVAIVQLIPGSSYLQLNDKGITICNLYRKSSIPWQVIEEFSVVTLEQSGLPVHKMVAFNYVQSYDRARVARRLAKLIGKCEGALPDTYGMKADDLAALLNTCLQSMKDNGSE